MNLKKILSDFGNWIFVALTFLGAIIIYAGVGGRGRGQRPGEINWYFIAVGAVLMIPCLIYIIKARFMEQKSIDDTSKRINDLLTKGDKITINLDQLEIKTNSYQQEIEVGSGYRTRNEQIPINHNVILLKETYKGHNIHQRIDIYMEPTKLKMHFAIKGTTELYVDPQNPDNNYLDLKFLEH